MSVLRSVRMHHATSRLLCCFLFSNCSLSTTSSLFFFFGRGGRFLFLKAKQNNSSPAMKSIFKCWNFSGIAVITAWIAVTWSSVHHLNTFGVCTLSDLVEIPASVWMDCEDDGPFWFPFVPFWSVLVWALESCFCGSDSDLTCVPSSLYRWINISWWPRTPCSKSKTPSLSPFSLCHITFHSSLLLICFSFDFSIWPLCLGCGSNVLPCVSSGSSVQSG